MVITILKSRLGQLALALLIGTTTGALIHHKLHKPDIQVREVHDTKIVTVDNPVLTEKIVDRVIVDPKQQQAITSVLKENRELKVKLSQVSSTLATARSTGGTEAGPVQGTLTEVRQPATEPSEQPKTQFKDYQLTATYGPKTFDYSLTQTFIITTTFGKDSSGQPVGISRLFQDTPTGLTPVVAKTTLIVANPDPSHWIVSPRGQLGFGIDQNKTQFGLLALQWLKHGTSKDPKDLRWAFLSPTIYAPFNTGQNLGYGILPVSLNLGSFKYDPLSNVWVSVLLDKDHKLGLTLSLTF